MPALERMLRRSVPRYYPFSEGRYRGAYPVGSPRRGIFNSTNSSLSRRLLVTNQVLSAGKSPLSLYEDRRLWHPEGAYASPRSLVQFTPQLTLSDSGSIWNPVGVPHRPNLIPRPFHPVRRIKGDDVDVRTGEVLRFGAYNPFKVSWDNPWKMIICLKRKMRREVMHALGYAGKTGFKKPTFNQYSYVRCF